MTVEIRAFEPNNDPDSSVIADMVVYLPKMHITFSRIRLVRTKAGGIFVGVPSYKFEEQWLKYFNWDEKAGQAFNEQVLEAAKPYLAGEPTPPPIAEDGNVPF